ncbi:hypothetical protein B0H10DRAFT_2043768 [Mycena sp. CBHHK59/15]|nr:hypothetical protein B0H10DRAFT_2043768 [Mycena sp. CBHHK59/15]
MYHFCYQRGLREVWGYMWVAWYCPAKYRLWARASQPNFIGRWQTTTVRKSGDFFWEFYDFFHCHGILLTTAAVVTVTRRDLGDTTSPP